MAKIKLLDCTLRDGGYVNNWEFGRENIRQIIKNLVSAKLDYIECGFLKNTIYNSDYSLFDSFSDLFEFLPEKSDSVYTLMVNFGEIRIEKIPQCEADNIGIRVAFKKENFNEAIEFCRQIKEKGYKLFINPQQTIIYNTSEILNLIEKVNEIKPYAFTIVDTSGSMKKQDVLSLFYMAEKHLNKNINLGFHSHNNLKLSFSNAQALMEQYTERTLIIDTTVFGMGRGAGNICSEHMTKYLNDNYGGEYNLLPILKTIDEQINPIFRKTPWGYSVPYYLAALNYCHPNYAKFLIEKKSVSVDVINDILQRIPQDKKSTYDEKFISKMLEETKVVV